MSVKTSKSHNYYSTGLGKGPGLGSLESLVQVEAKALSPLVGMPLWEFPRIPQSEGILGIPHDVTLKTTWCFGISLISQDEDTSRFLV